MKIDYSRTYSNCKPVICNPIVAHSLFYCFFGHSVNSTIVYEVENNIKQLRFIHELILLVSLLVNLPYKLHPPTGNNNQRANFEAELPC